MRLDTSKAPLVFRVRTPILAKTPLGGKKLPYMAEAERRSAGNAKTQSYGLLNRAAIANFRELVDASPYRYDIFLVSLIPLTQHISCAEIIQKWLNGLMTAIPMYAMAGIT